MLLLLLHIRLSSDFMATFLFGGRRPSQGRFVKASKNFIFVSEMNGKFVRTRPVQGSRGHEENADRCVLAAPHVSQHAVKKCVGDHKTGLLSCDGLDNNEKTFEEFMQKRTHTMFFMGQVRGRPRL